MFTPYLGKWSNLTCIFFQMGWFNHQLVWKWWLDRIGGWYFFLWWHNVICSLFLQGVSHCSISGYSRTQNLSSCVSKPEPVFDYKDHQWVTAGVHVYDMYTCNMTNLWFFKVSLWIQHDLLWQGWSEGGPRLGRWRCSKGEQKGVHTRSLVRRQKGVHIGYQFRNSSASVSTPKLGNEWMSFNAREMACDRSGTPWPSQPTQCGGHLGVSGTVVPKAS